MISPSASVAVGVNEYGIPTVAVVGGVPEMVGTTANALPVASAATSAKTVNANHETKGPVFRESIRRVICIALNLVRCSARTLHDK